MVTVPFYKMNYLLFNCKKKFWEVDSGYQFSFFEYVKSQLHFPLTPSLYNRELSDYKKVYLYLKGSEELDLGAVSRVLRYFYSDLYNSFRWADVEKFNLDYSGIVNLFPHVTLDSTLSMNDKLVELNKAYFSDEVYLVFIGGED